MKFTDSSNNEITLPRFTLEVVGEHFSNGGDVSFERFETVPDWYLVAYGDHLSGLDPRAPSTLRKKVLDMDPGDVLTKSFSKIPNSQLPAPFEPMAHPTLRTDSKSDPGWSIIFPYPDETIASAPDLHANILFFKKAFENGLPTSEERGFLPFDADAHPFDAVITRSPTHGWDYLSMTKAALLQGHPLVRVTGPTGSGKSTFGLLNMIQTQTALILCPTQTNVANLLVEFRDTMPKTVARLGLKNQFTKGPLFVPEVGYAGVEQLLCSPGQITLCTYADFNAFVMMFGEFPPQHLIIMDESHLSTTLHAVLSRLIITHCSRREPMEYKQVRVLMSATHAGKKAVMGTSANVKRIALPAPMPDIITTPVPDMFKPSSYKAYPFPMLQVFADSTESARILERNLNVEGIQAIALTEETDINVATAAFEAPYAERVFITTPPTSIGTTLKVNVGINPNLVSYTKFEKGLLYLAREQQGPSGTLQAEGRMGRVLNSLYYSYPSNAKERPDTASLPLLADAATYMTLLTGDVCLVPETKPAFVAYPKLAQVTCLQAAEALKHLYTENSAGAQRGSVFLNTFKCDILGETYTEYGGSASHFAQHNAESFILFTWPSGFAYAPFLDTTSEQDLRTTSTPQVEKAVTDIIKANAKGKYDNLKDMMDLVASRPKPYMDGLAKALKDFDGGSSFDEASPNSKTNNTLQYMFGAEVGNFLTALGPRNVWVNVEIAPGGKYRRVVHLRLASGTIKKLSYKCPVKWRRKATSALFLGMVDGSAVQQVVHKELLPTLMASLLRDDPNRCTNLVEYKHLQALSNNTWFKSLAL